MVTVIVVEIMCWNPADVVVRSSTEVFCPHRDLCDAGPVPFSFDVGREFCSSRYFRDQ